MKYGMRKPSVKKSIKARTTGNVKRAVKKAVVPGYGKKGSGWVKDPKKAAYNKVYNKTTFGVNDVYKGSSHSSSSKRTYSDNIQPDTSKTSFLEIQNILTPQELKKYHSLYRAGCVIGEDPGGIIKPNGSIAKLTMYKVSRILALVVAVLLLLFGLLVLITSIPAGLIFIVVSIPFFAMARTYKTITSMHNKIYELNVKNHRI